MADKQQLLAINHEVGPALILAGPGSGKTYVLTHHISYLINFLGVSPNQILVLTFTKEAARNMRSRFLSMGNSSEGIVFGTFHSVFYKFLRYRFGNKYTIISSEKCIEYLSQIINRPSEASEVLSLISKFKSTFHKRDISSYNFSYKDFEAVYSQYMALLNDRNELDYDDILIKCLETFKADLYYRNEIFRQYKYILIDEFQDVSEIQYEIIRTLTDADSHVFAVGDEDQSIYGFRGASKDIMKQFIREYNNVSIIELRNNYRSTSEIIEKAFSLISHNTGRLNLIRQNCLTNNDNSFVLRCLDKSDDWKMQLQYDIFECADAGYNCGILVRTNSDAEVIRKIIFNSQSDFNISVSNEIYNIFSSYLSYILYPNKQDFYYILNIPERYIETALFSFFPPDFDRIISSSKNIKTKTSLSMFINQMNMLSNCTTIAFVMYLWNICGVKKYIFERYPNSSTQINDVWANVLELAKKNPDKQSFMNCLRENVQKIINDEKSNIKIMTYHASKGLEFDATFLPNVCEGHVPGRSGILQSGIEEERRLFYVAMTRAKKKLYVYTGEDKINHSILPSRFINEMMKAK